MFTKNNPIKILLKGTGLIKVDEFCILRTKYMTIRAVSSLSLNITVTYTKYMTNYTFEGELPIERSLFNPQAIDLFNFEKYKVISSNI
jgi:hypothetical protein